MMQNEDCSEEEKANAKLSTAVYKVADIFLQVGTQRFVPCRQDVVNIKVGNLIIFQRNGDVPLSLGVLVFGRVKSITVSPVSRKWSVFCELYEISNERRLTSKPNSEMVPYEHLRVKLLDENFAGQGQVSLNDFEPFPSLTYFE